MAGRFLDEYYKSVVYNSFCPTGYVQIGAPLILVQ